MRKASVTFVFISTAIVFLVLFLPANTDEAQEKGVERKMDKSKSLDIGVVDAFDGPQMPIIVLPDVPLERFPNRYVMLRLEYGIIISNLDITKLPEYYLFYRDDNKILKTKDVKVFIEELNKLPEECTIDNISKCTVPFYSQYGVNINKEWKLVKEIVDKKRFKMVYSQEDDSRHATFCYCERGFKILEKGVMGEVVADNPKKEVHKRPD